MQSVYSSAQADWATCWERLTFLWRCSRCIFQPQLTGQFFGKVLPLYCDAVGVIFSSSRLSHSLRTSYPSVEIQSVYSSAPAEVSGISTRTMHQSTTPSFSQTIWPRWASGQFLTLPIVQTLLTVTFGYSLSSEAVVMRQLRRWKRLWRRSFTRSHKRTSMGPSGSC